MMDEIKSMAESLGQFLVNSPAYQEYAAYAKKMEKKPAMAETISRLKEAQASLAPDLPEGIVTLENERRLCDMYAEIAMDEDAIGFWHSERRLLELLQETLETVTNKVPINLCGRLDEH